MVKKENKIKKKKDWIQRLDSKIGEIEIVREEKGGCKSRLEERERQIFRRKGRLRKFLEGKQKEKREKEKKKLMEIRKETEMWRYINRKRGRRTMNENDIKKRKWKEHFKELLGGTETELEVEKRRNTGERLRRKGGWRHPRKRNVGRDEKDKEKESSRNR